MVHTPVLARAAAALSGAALLMMLGACSSSQTTSTAATTANTTADAGSVTMFAPADGITMSQRTPLNKWAKLIPQITGDLKKQGVEKQNISTVISADLDKQSQQLQDWVVKHVTNLKKGSQTAQHSTLIVAPASQTNASSRQYGDYVTQPVVKGAQDSEQREAESRMRSALQLARKAGMHVVLVSNTVSGFTPDAFVQCSTPEQVGELQANMLVSKLDLGKVSKDNPKSIEVLLPYAYADDSDSATSDDAEINDDFAKEAFKGVWKILKPYYEQGKVYSPSGSLSKDTTDDDWQSVAFDLNKKDGAANTIAERIPTIKKDGASVRTRIDGIIAMNDAVASSVVDKLDDMGYTGSSADINPSITIPGIVGNIAGHKDLLRKSVPDPAKSPTNDPQSQREESHSGASSSAQSSHDSRWPVITGYGSYADTIPQVVNGKQWMTGLENRDELSTDIARTCVRLNRGKGFSGLSYITEQSIDGVKTPTIHEELIAVSAGNLKATLIDPGYISMAEAGL